MSGFDTGTCLSIANGNFAINTYLSSNNSFDPSEDILVGDLTTGKIRVGTVQDVPASINIPDYSSRFNRNGSTHQCKW